MAKWVRRIRSAVVLGLTWATVWFAAGLVLLLVVGFGAADVPFPLFFGLLGFLAGATFSLLLAVIERRRKFDQLSLSRSAGWGALGGLLLAIALVLVSGLGDEVLVLGPVFALSGAICAAGTLAVARWADTQTLLDAGIDAAPVGRGTEEARERIGGTD